LGDAGALFNSDWPSVRSKARSTITTPDQRGSSFSSFFFLKATECQNQVPGVKSLLVG